MADSAVLDTIPDDWTTPGFLADTTPQALPSVRATPAMALRQPDTSLDPDAALAHIDSLAPAAASAPSAGSFDPDAALAHLDSMGKALDAAQKVAPAAMQTFDAMNQWQDVQRHVKMEDFNPDAALAHLDSLNSEQNWKTAANVFNAVASPLQDISDLANRAGQGANLAKITSTLGESPLHLAINLATGKFDEGPKTTAAIPAPPPQESMPGILGGLENALNAEGRTVLGGLVFNPIQWGASLLSQFDPTVNQADDTTNPYVQYAVNLRSKLNQNFPEDPDRPISSAVGNVAGMVLPVAVTGGAAAVPEASAGVLSAAAKGIGGGMFGGQMFTDASDRGASTGGANLAGAAGVGLGTLMPATSLFHASPYMAGATWGKLGFDTLLNTSKGYWEMAGINTAAGEISNAVVPAGQQQSQDKIIYDSLLAPQSVAMGAIGGASHLLGAGIVEHEVGRIAAGDYGKEGGSIGPAQDKASFLINTAQAIDAAANDLTKTPEQRLLAVSGFLSNFSPQAQAVISAHVANIGETVAKIKAATIQGMELAKTNPITAPVLTQEAKNAAITEMQDKAVPIEQQADEAGKAAEAAAPETKPEEPETVTPPVETKPPVPETKQPASESVESPIPGGMASDEYDALAKHMDNSPDPDIQARARQLLLARQAALQEHAATDSAAKKAELEQEIRDHEAALQALASEPVREEPPVTPPVSARIEPMTLAYDEYGKPIHVEPSPESQKEAKTQTAAEPAPVAEAQPERGETPESAPAVAEERPAEIPAHVNASLDEAEQKLAAGDHAGAEAALEKAHEVFSGSGVTDKAVNDLYRERSSKIAEALIDAAARVPEPTSDVSKMKRADLEKVAADEGHGAKTVAATKGVKALRDLIEAKREAQRVMATPVTNKGALVKDGKAMADPKIKSLPKEYRDAVQAFIDAAQKMGKGLRRIRNFVLDTDGNSRIFVDPRSGDFETIYINPVELANDLRYIKSQGYDDKAMAHHLRTVFNEEWIHNQTGVILNKNWKAAGAKGDFAKYYGDNFKAVHDRMTQEERDQTVADYGPTLTHPESIGEEFFRATIQKALGQDTTEQVIAKIRKQLKVNPPMRTLFQSLADRFNTLLAKLGHDPEVALIAQKLGDVLGKKAVKTAEPIEAKEGKAAAPQVSPEEAAPVRDGFYSQMERVIAAKMPGKASADQVRAMLKGNSVKDDELKWSGVDDYLREHPTATKADLQNFLKTEGGVKVSTEELGDVTGAKAAQRDTIAKQSVEINRQIGQLNLKLYDLDEKSKEYKALKVQKDALIQQDIELNEKFRELGNKQSTKFGGGDLVLPGGENYREQVFSLPEEKGYKGVPPWNGLGKRPEKTVGSTYTSSHFPDQPNYLAHMRLNDRTDADGNPGTFIEEMQSDRHQQGREQGYQASPEESAERLAQLHEERKKLVELASEKPMPRNEAEWTPEHWERMRRITDLNDEIRNAGKGIPDAPFRNTWHEFLFRKALNDAVASGKKWLGWTTGETQADRYNLAHQVNSVSFRREGDKFQLYAEPKNGEGEINLGLKGADELEGTVGKDLAKQIIESKENAHTFDNAALRLNTEQSRGMSTFYDKIVPKYVEKYVKKWGTKPELSSIDVPAKSKQQSRFELQQGIDSEYGEGFWNSLTPQERREYEQEANIKAQKAGTAPIWKLPINDEMAKSVKESGQPLFAASPKLAPDEDAAWLEDDAGTHAAQEDFRSTKSPEELAAYHPFVREGETPIEMPPEPEEKLEPERAVPSLGEEREQRLARQAESLKHVELPTQKQEDYNAMADKLATMHFGEKAGNRDIAAADAKVKVLTEAKKWQEKNGSLEGFGARRVIQNALLDAGRRFAQGEARTSTRAEKPLENDNPDYDAEQQKFETVGEEAQPVVTRETPAMSTQDKFIRKNLNDVINKLSPYGQRLLTAFKETPNDPRAAFPGFVNKVVRELGVPRAKVLSDWDTLLKGLHAELTARGLNREDMSALKPGAPPLAPEEGEGAKRPVEFTQRVASDPKVSEAIRNVLSSVEYTRIANQSAAAQGKAFLDAHTPEAARDILWEKGLHGNPGPADAAAVFQLCRQLRDSPNGSDRLKAAELYSLYGSRATTSGQFIQAFRMYSYLGADGVLEAYRNIVRPAIDKARERYANVADALDAAIKDSIPDVIESTLDFIGKLKGGKLIDIYEGAGLDNTQHEKPTWQQHMERAAAAISEVAGDVKSPVVKGALGEFAQRMQQNLKALVDERMAKKTPPPKPTPKPTPMSAEAKVKEIYNNDPEYREAWEYAKTYIDAKYADHPDILAAYHDALESSLRIPVKLLDKTLIESLKASNIKIADVAREWAGSQERTKQRLIDDLKSRIGLNAEQAKALGNAIATRFNERLATAKKAELAKLLRQSGQNKLANDAPALSAKIFQAINLGVADHEAVWNALADKLKLPKYDPAVAADLASRAEKIQKMVDKNGPTFITDHMTQDMMDVLANEHQKYMSKWKQLAQGALAVFRGNIFGPATIIRKTASEIMNLFSEVGTYGIAVGLRDRDPLAPARAIGGILSGLVNRGIPDAIKILSEGRGLRQQGDEYSAKGGKYGSSSLAERGRVFGDIPGLSMLNRPTAYYKYVSRALYGAQAFFYSGAAYGARAVVANRVVRQMIKNGEVPETAKVADLVQEIMQNTPELRATFRQQAIDEGLKGNDVKLRAAELAEQRMPDFLRKVGEDLGTRATFMQEPEGLLGELYKRTIKPFTAYHENQGVTSQAVSFVGQVTIPVAKVMVNVFNNFQSYTPAGIAGAMRLAKEGESDRAAQQYVKMAAGAIGTLGMWMAFGPNISGAGPRDPDDKKDKLNEGWIPYSIKVGNRYYSYRESMLALPLAALGNYMDELKYGKPDESTSDRLIAALQGTAQFAANSTFLMEVNNIMGTFEAHSIKEMQDNLGRTVGSIAGAMIPGNQAALRMLDRLYDPNLYKPSTILGHIASQIPFIRSGVSEGRPALNCWGEPIQLHALSAFTSLESNDALTQMMGEKDVHFRPPDSSEKVGARTITPVELYGVIQNAGQATKAILSSRGLDVMANMDHDQAQAYVKGIYHEQVAAALATVRADALQRGEPPANKPAYRPRASGQ